MRVDGVDPAELNRILEQSKNPVSRETQDQPHRQRQHEKVLGRDQQVLEFDRSHMEELEEALKKVNSASEIFELGLRFDLREEGERVAVEVVDRSQDQVMREIPPERVLNMVAQIQNLIGLFIDTRR